MLIDDFMPSYDFSETHDIKIRAKADNVYRVLNTVDLCESPVIRLLFRLRGMPAGKTTLRELRKMRFEILGENENQEIVLGLTGRFWKIKGDIQQIKSEDFRNFSEKGFAKAAWSFSLDDKGGTTRLKTETRVRCLDEKSRKDFGFYWTLIQPFSGWIRKEMLKIIKKHAEKAN
ncbi:MAG: hypothetical protein M3209_19115 [Acidobacteriota bacterium]|nr:hypothetical protein [Acidobacteriota bacterium]